MQKLREVKTHLDEHRSSVVAPDGRLSIPKGSTAHCRQPGALVGDADTIVTSLRWPTSTGTLRCLLLSDGLVAALAPGCRAGGWGRLLKAPSSFGRATWEGETLLSTCFRTGLPGSSTLCLHFSHGQEFWPSGPNVAETGPSLP